MMKEVSIKDLGEIVTGHTPPKKDSNNYGGPYPFIKPTDMDVDRRRVANWEESYSEKAFEKYKKAYIPPGSTGVVTIGTVGEKIFQSHIHCFTNQSVNVVKPNDNYDNDYVYYLLKLNLNKVLSANPGTASGRHHVSKSNFSSIKIRVITEVNKQKRIGDVLGRYDDLIENNLKRINILEQAAQNIYNEWFVNMRFPGHESAEFDSETGLPKGWKMETLDSLTKIKRGKTITKSTINEGSIPVVAGGLNPAYYHDTPNTKYPVVTISASGANAGYVNLYMEDIWASDCSYIDQNTNKYIYFIYNLLINRQDEIYAMQRGSAQPHVYPKDLIRLGISLPTNELIIQYENKVKSMYLLIKNLKSFNNKLKEARDILLPRLMNQTIEV